MSDAELATVWVEGHGWKPAILFAGRTWTRAIIITPKIIVVRQKFTMKKPLDGTLAKRAAQFRGLARRNGSTKEARDLLRGL